MICGDFNCRTGTEPDFVVFDNDAISDFLPDGYQIDENFLRFSQDKILNTNGRKLLDFCKANGLRICNGRLGDDKGMGKYTYVGSTGSSVVDYVIVNPSLIDYFSKFQVQGPNILSDHCCVEFAFLHNDMQKIENNDLTRAITSEKYRRSLFGKRKDKKSIVVV